MTMLVMEHGPSHTNSTGLNLSTAKTDGKPTPHAGTLPSGGIQRYSDLIQT